MPANKKLAFDQLPIAKLEIVIEHLERGPDHLKRHFSRSQFRELLASAKLNKRQKELVGSSGSEKSSNLILVFNSMFTGTLGAWLSLTGFLEIGQQSVMGMAIITIISAALGMALGSYSYKLVKRRSGRAVVELKLKLIQLKLFRLIIKKNKEKIHKSIESINNAINSINKTSKGLELKHVVVNSHFEPNEFASEWLFKLDVVIQSVGNIAQNDDILQFYASELMAARNDLQKQLTAETFKDESNHKYAVTSNIPAVANSSQNSAAELIEVLSSKDLFVKEKITRRSWIRNNLGSILISFIPVLVGGFGSAFIYVDKLPKTLKAFNINADAIYQNPNYKSVLLIIAIGITIYFSYSVFNINRKAFLRELELHATENRVLNKEANLIKIDKKYKIFKGVKQKIKKIEHLIKILEKFYERYK